MQELPASLLPGAHVAARAEPWQVVDVEPRGPVAFVSLRGIGHDNRGRMCTLATPFDRITVVRRRRDPKSASRHRVRLATAAALIEAAPWDTCRTAAAARIDLRPWQLEPALAVLSGATRLLLADAVGLGKTIEALLIVSELWGRGLARRVLILTPASLRGQWADELSCRFGLEASTFDHGTLTALAGRLPAGVNPWCAAPLIVSSIDLVKRPEVRAAVDAAAFDVLVVDEAHHLTPGTDRAALVADLAARTAWVVLVTATPHSGDESAYRFLLGIGQTRPAASGPGDHGSHPAADADGPVVFRRTAAAVQVLTRRHVRTIAVAPTVEERALLTATYDYACAVWRGNAHPGARLVAAIIARRASSSADAARRTLERRLALIAGDAVAEEQAALPWEDDVGDGPDDDGRLAVPGLASPTDEASWLERLVHLARQAAPVSSKTRLLCRLLRRTREPVLVFSEYRDVVQAVAAALAAAPAGVLHGGLSAAARRQVVDEFTSGRLRTLIATDAAGEGLNLHQRCRLVVNLELPWNPLRVEQRIGRVDRLGQRRTVHAVHLVHRGSYEDEVIRRLERRRAAAGDQVSRSSPRGEDGVAAIVFGDAIVVDEPAEPAVPGVNAPAASSGAAAVIVTERRLRARLGCAASHPTGGAPLFARRGPRRCPGRAVTMIFAVDLLDGAGRLVQREIVPLRVELAGAPRRSLERAPLATLAADARIAARVAAAADARLAGATCAVGRAAGGLERRAHAILQALALRRRPSPVQRSLFDRRAEQQVRTRQDALAALEGSIARHLDTAAALQQLAAGEPRLLAAWLSD